MTELELYKYINDHKIEWHRAIRDGKEDILIMPAFDFLKAFTEMLGQSIFDDEGVESMLRDGYLCIWMQDICDFHGVEMNNVFIGGWDHE